MNMSKYMFFYKHKVHKHTEPQIWDGKILKTCPLSLETFKSESVGQESISDTWLGLGLRRELTKNGFENKHKVNFMKDNKQGDFRAFYMNFTYISEAHLE